MLRGKFNIQEYLHKRWGTSGEDLQDYSIKTNDPLQAISIDDIKRMIDSMKEEQQSIIEDLGSDYANIAKAGICFQIAPKALEVGLKKAKAYKDRYVATSQIIAGEFAKDDTVTVTTNGRNITVQILDVIECSNSSTFKTELAANTGNHKASAGTGAWIILDLTEGVEEGSLIQK